MSRVVNKFRAWRYGYTGITGLNQMQNNFKMLIIVLGPFLGVWFGAQYILIMGWVPPELEGLTLLGAIGVWLTYCVVYWAYVTTDANRFKGLPQATCYFPDGGVKKFDFLIPPDGITERCDFKKGAKGVEIAFLNRYLYKARDMDFPYVFQSILAKVPAKVGESFKFLSEGEFWHKGMVVETPNCEHISFFCYGWVKENGEWKPVGAINDCSIRFERALEKFKGANEVDFLESDMYFMLYHGALQREDELRDYNLTLEETLETALEQMGPKVKKQVDNVLEAVRERVHKITDVRESRWKTLFNFKNILKAIFVVVVLWLVLHYLFKLI